jgi:putative restriction endonuclease
MTPLLPTLLSLVPESTGFDRELGAADGWLAFASSRVPLRVWLRAVNDTTIAVALDAPALVAQLEPAGDPSAIPPPTTNATVRVVPNRQVLHRLLRRAFQLSRALPSAPLAVFEAKVKELPSKTEVERIHRERVGQGVFRDSLLDYWDGRCAITGLALPALLRASHIKPWADCASDAERLDVFNGILLAAHLDAAFDSGLISFDNEGVLLISSTLPMEARTMLSLDEPLKLVTTDGHRKYLPWHRQRVFQP